jgi:DNA polymerase/3'-5' exonuclease PolX
MNKELIENFRVLQSYYRSQGDKGRTIAYGKAINALRGVDSTITNVYQLKGIRGIGPKVTAKVKEFLDTGKIQAAEDKKREIQKSVKKTGKAKVLEDFQTIWGIGPRKAETLYDKGIHSLRALKRNKEVLTKQQKIGLKYRKDLLKKIDRQMITTMNVLFVYFLNKRYGADSYDLKIAGSYRRGADRSGDIDCLITSTRFNLNDVVKLFKSKKIITDTLSMKNEKFMGVAHCPAGGTHLRLDIEFVPIESWGSALLYFTGSKGFNVYMRAEAKRKGMLLNEHGLYNIKTGRKVLESPTEEEIFRKIGLPFRPPHRR